MASDTLTDTPTAPRPRAARRRKIHWLLVFVSCVLVTNALFGERGLMETLRARQEYVTLAASIERLQRENQRLRAEARRLREDPRRIEEIARRELGLIRPGEILVIVKDTTAPAPPPK